MAKATIKSDIEQYLKRLKKAINKSKKNMAKIAFSELVRSSPVFSGAYVKSHRVTLNVIDKSHEPYVTITDPRVLASMYQSTRESGGFDVMAIKGPAKIKGLAIINKAKFDDTINISNSIPYAAQVEFIGWTRTGPYYPFSSAKRRLKSKTFLKSTVGFKESDFKEAAEDMAKIRDATLVPGAR